MTTEVELPDPWLHVEWLSEEARKSIELVLGTGLTRDDLLDEDFIEDARVGRLPATERAKAVVWHRWVRIRNVDTDVEVLIRLQPTDMASRAQEVTAVAFPHDMTRSLVGTDLRSLPVAALGAAYTKHENDGSAYLHIALTLGEKLKEIDPRAKLPSASAKPQFSARVALQYMSFEADLPGHKVPLAMAENNGTPLSTMQRWIARARKAGFLAPATPHSRRKSDG